MHFGTFWLRVYDLLLKLRSEAMAKQLGGIIGLYDENDPKESNRMGKFLRIKITMLKSCFQVQEATYLMFCVWENWSSIEGRRRTRKRGNGKHCLMLKLLRLRLTYSIPL